jgi:hypothetical protein
MAASPARDLGTIEASTNLAAEILHVGVFATAFSNA